MDQLTIDYNCISINSLRGCAFVLRPNTTGIIGIPDLDGKVKQKLLDLKQNEATRHQSFYLRILGTLYGSISCIGTDVTITDSGSVVNCRTPDDHRNAVGIEFSILAEITEDVHQTLLS